MAHSHYSQDINGKWWEYFDKKNHKGLIRVGAKHSVCTGCGESFLHRSAVQRLFCTKACSAQRFRDKNRSWKGGRLIKDGYVALRIPPDCPWVEKVPASGYAREHRLVMAEAIGRPLRSWETVHHINGDRQDNRLENLELWAKTQPAGQRIEDLVAWANEILDLYVPTSP